MPSRQNALVESESLFARGGHECLLQVLIWREGPDRVDTNRAEITGRARWCDHRGLFSSFGITRQCFHRVGDGRSRDGERR